MPRRRRPTRWRGPSHRSRPGRRFRGPLAPAAGPSGASAELHVQLIAIAAVGRLDELADQPRAVRGESVDPEHRQPGRQLEQLALFAGGRGRLDRLAGGRELEPVLVTQDLVERAMLQIVLEHARATGMWEMARLDRQRLPVGQAESADPDQLRAGSDPQGMSKLDRCRQEVGMEQPARGAKAARGDVLGEARQALERLFDLPLGDVGTLAAPRVELAVLDHLEERLPDGHAAHAEAGRQLALRWDAPMRFQLAAADGTVDDRLHLRVDRGWALPVQHWPAVQEPQRQPPACERPAPRGETCGTRPV